MTAQLEKIELNQINQLRLPDVPQLEDKRYERLCFCYREMPNLSAALDHLGFKYTTKEGKHRMMRAIRKMNIVGAFLEQVDKVYKQQQQQRQQTRELTIIAADVYSSLPTEGLTDQEERFILNYAGDVKEAMKKAGMKPTTRNKLLLLKSPLVQECKQIIDSMLFSANVATSAEVCSTLSDILRDEVLKPSERIAAAKLLMQKDGLLKDPDKRGDTNVQINIATHLE